MLADIGHARSGDKGDSCNIGFVVWDRALYPLVLEVATAQRVQEHFAGIVDGPVTRYEIPSIGALNFVLERALDGGGTRTLRLDALGKSMGEGLLRMEVDVPAELAIHVRPRPQLSASNEPIVIRKRPEAVGHG
jgi:hypothetical protein